jgi:alcohol dehydrogenase (NADP+)
VRSRSGTPQRRGNTRKLTFEARAYGGQDKSSPLGPLSIPRREPGPRDVVIDSEFCGVCHSDIHTVRSEWSGTHYPCVPGHEIVGRVSRVGSGVRKFKVGDRAAVGCLVDSCQKCASCSEGFEQFCDEGLATWTYNSVDRKMRGQYTYGGYSSHIVVDENFCLRVPKTLDPAAAAPLLCAGITTYSPLRHWGAGKGTKIGIVGLGGLGHMGLKFAHAFGAETVLFTTSPKKRADAKRFGADAVVISNDVSAMKRHKDSFDMILDTVAMPHDLDAYTSLLKRDGSLVLVGVPEHSHPSPSPSKLIAKRRSIAGSLIGGIRETQEMLDYCGKRGIESDVEVIRIQQINEAYERMLRSDVRYRFVIDLASLGPKD